MFLSAPGFRRHFGGKSAEEFISEYTSIRNAWNFAVQEPDGPGTAGREVLIIAYGDTMNDLDKMVVDTVCHVGHWRVSDFDFCAWKKRWENAKGRPDENWVERLVARLRRKLDNP